MVAIAPPAAKTPTEKLYASFDASPRGNGWHRVPKTAAHPKFDFLEAENGDIILHAWNNASAESILAAGNPPLRPADLYASPGQYSRVARRDTLDLLAYAHHFKLPLEYLYSIGYSDGYRYNGKRAVKVGGYCLPDGTEHSKVKVRLSLGGDRRFRWDENTPGKPIPCGLHLLDQARRAGFLIIGEGESDAAVCWFHDVPFLGIPGASSSHLLDVSLVLDIPVIFINEEPDQARKLAETGKAFYSSTRQHLRDGGYTGAIYSIRFHQATGYKDPAMLHKEVWATCDLEEEAPFLSTVKARFAEAIAAALESAIPEGNEGEGEQAADTGLAPILRHAEVDRLTWFAAVCRVDINTMRGEHKITFMVCILYGWPLGCDKWWDVDPDEMAAKAGQPRETFLDNLAYLTNGLGLFIKGNLKQSFKYESGPKRGQAGRTEQIKLKPAPKLWLAYPSTIHLQPGQKPLPVRGGKRPRTKVEAPPTPPIVESKPPVDEGLPIGPLPCEWCGNIHTLPYAAYCEPCEHVTYPQIPDDDPEEEDPPKSQEVESTLTVLPLVEAEKEPEKESALCRVKLTLHSIGKDKSGQLDPTYADSVMPAQDWITDTPCPTCSLPFQLLYAGITAPTCPRCCPPRGSSPPEWDSDYPRKRRRLAVSP